MRAKLKDIADFINGRGFKTSEWSDNGLPIIRIQNLNDSEKPFNYFNGEYDKKHYVESGDTLLSWSGTPGTSFGCFKWSREDGLLNQHIFKVHLKSDQVDQDYFIYAVNKNLNVLIDQAHGGVGLKHITKGKLNEVTIYLPPLPVQKKIAAILDAADAYRQKTKALIEKYDELTQSLFLDMFGDPVFNQKGFEKTTIRKIVRSVKYGTSAKAAAEGQYAYLRMNNITFKGFMDYSSLKYIDIDDSNKHKYLARKNDILFNRTNSKELVGKTGLVTTDDEMIIAGYLIRVRVQEDMNPYFVWAHLNSRWAKITLNKMCKNIVGMANINAQELQNIVILKPVKALQDKFARNVKKIEQQKSDSKESLAKAEELFQCLLQKAFKGELIN